jgi:hypothetical protein
MKATSVTRHHWPKLLAGLLTASLGSPQLHGSPRLTVAVFSPAWQGSSPHPAGWLSRLDVQAGADTQPLSPVSASRLPVRAG